MQNLLVQSGKLIICMSLLWTIFNASAQSNYPRDIQLSWNWPTLYVDNTEIQDGDLASARLICTRHDSVVAFDTIIPIGNGVLPGERQTQIFVGDIPKPGTYSCVAFAITIDGTSSDSSEAVLKKFTGKPNPPNNFGLQ